MNSRSRYWTRMKELEAILKRVRELHTPEPHTPHCAHCRSYYPCPTIEAIDTQEDH